MMNLRRITKGSTIVGDNIDSVVDPSSLDAIVKPFVYYHRHTVTN